MRAALLSLLLACTASDFVTSRKAGLQRKILADTDGCRWLAGPDIWECVGCYRKARAVCRDAGFEENCAFDQGEENRSCF